MNVKHILVFLTCCSLGLAGRAADFSQAVNDLIPRLAGSDVGARYAAQMELQELAANSSRPGRGADRVALSRVLAEKVADASVPQPARVWMVRQLEYMGGAEAIDALTIVMNGNDVELRECARRALEKNPNRSAIAKLRSALEAAQDTPWKIGLIHSLGQRADARSVDLIAKHLNDNATATAAALALGRIATLPAVDALWLALD